MEFDLCVNKVAAVDDRINDLAVDDKSNNSNQSSVNESTLFNPQKFTHKQFRILVVEDDPIIQKINLIFLQNMGFRADLAKNATEALAFDHSRYNLILLDIGLPDFDGTVVSNIIRQKFSKDQLPIVALTAHAKYFENECLSSGINEVLQKPIRFEALKIVLDHWLLSVQAA